MSKSTEPNFSHFEELCGLVFKNKELLRRAFTHRSFLNENRSSESAHNERLEFLGDAVLELIVTEYLFEKYPDSTEGDLTAYRAALVNAITLSEAAQKIKVNDFLLLSKGEAKDTGKARQYILANTMEAIIGAIYLDQGYDASKYFISNNIFHLIDKIVADKSWIDAKSKFQEKSQELAGTTPVYKLLKEEGPDHDKHFTVGVFLNDSKVATGTGQSKQEAEQVAAREALEFKKWL